MLSLVVVSYSSLLC
uniref:Uncharacterized protein n=1 Tax=Arundo donax TaxID=35708 RepID=A0A0A9BF48_ARUDO